MRLKRRDIRRREGDRLLEELRARFNLKIDLRVGKFEVTEFDGVSIYILDGRPLLFKADGKLYPTLLFDEAINILPRIIVDQGAIPHICRGADVMAPGIVRIDGSFHEGDLVVVCDEKYGKTIALGIALRDSEAIELMDKGKAVENIHYVGDKIWEVAKAIKAST
jgi:PUA domain protein